MRPLAIIFAINASLANAQSVNVPSGQPVEFVEVVRDTRGPQGLTWRFRFVAPEIDRTSGSIGFEEAAVDMDHLCNKFAVPRLPTMGPVPKQIVISMSDAPVDFGAPAPEITQFFEAYRVEDDSCIWEGI
ncbi:DUF6497 family protein [Pseudoruegeria sp. HB172150]|uniref:DUF6497 family protein n=1 Tax=Pseudoruegeria sp. HB172150 TaxID=2721164 RepID=UPI00155315B7|nr:DUF6497 family protein [Pseudoruegeria sp. HB172150]